MAKLAQRDLPDNGIGVFRPAFVRRLDQQQEAPAAGLRLGQRVAHASFGEGIVVDSEGSGTHARVQVNFESAGAKWLVLAYANLSPL